MVKWELLHPRATIEHLGLLANFLSEHNPAKAAEQLHANYSHGGGWSPMPGWTLNDNNSIRYPGDPPIFPIAKATLRDETIFLYEHAWVAVVQPDRSFEIARMD